MLIDDQIEKHLNAKNNLFQFSKIDKENLLKNKENNKIKLRKENLEDFLMKTRTKTNDNSNLEINLENLNIHEELKEMNLMNTPPVI